MEEGNEPFSLLAVITLYKIMSDLVTKVPTKSQGSYDANSAWARARKTWTTQLLIRYGLLDSQVDKNGNITDFFNKEELFALKAEATACWDETHEVCDIGDNSNWEFVLQFPQDENCKVDVMKGTHSTDKKLLKVKVNYDK